MILSHARKFIYIRTFKTAGTSLEIALSKYCGKDDVISALNPAEENIRRDRYGIGGQNYALPLAEYRLRHIGEVLAKKRRAAKFSEHDSAFQIMNMVGPEIWNSYYKFACVRDPYDRCVSRYFYHRKFHLEAKRRSRWAADSIDQFITYNPEAIVENWAMYTAYDQVLVDKLVRYEHFEEDLGAVSDRLGLGENIHDELASINAKGDVRPTEARADLLEPRHKALISMLCAKEIDLVGYPRYDASTLADAEPPGAARG